MNNESLEVEARLRQQPNMNRPDLHLPLQSGANRGCNAGFEAGRSRTDKEQGKQDCQRRKDQDRFGTKVHWTIRKVRRQRVWSKK